MQKPQNNLVFSRESVRQVDADAINHFGIPGIVLMENASQALAKQAVRMLNKLSGTGGTSFKDNNEPTVIIICGGGNNGGDGFACARHLHNHNIQTIIIHLRPADQYQGDAKINFDIIAHMGLKMIDGSSDPIVALKQVNRKADLIIDCLLGTGLTSRVTFPTDAVIQWINHQPCSILSCDIPSGLDCDAGKPLGCAVTADATVTFVGLKQGFEKNRADKYTGEVITGNIGAPIETVIKHATGQTKDTAYGRPMGRLYNVFVDWKGRLSREMPGVLQRLESIDAKRILDVGCGTGQHIQALRDAGYEVHGADASQNMLNQSVELLGSDNGLHLWNMGESMPTELFDADPFDAVVCLGNVWPSLIHQEIVDAATRDLCQLLRPGGLLLVGLKALATRRKSGNPYLPLLKREHEGEPLYFIRFADFDAKPIAGIDVCRFHMIVIKGGIESYQLETIRQTTSQWRIWSPDQLQHCFERAGFSAVHVSGNIGDPNIEPATEDVFVHCIK